MIGKNKNGLTVLFCNTTAKCCALSSLILLSLKWSMMSVCIERWCTIDGEKKNFLPCYSVGNELDIVTFGPLSTYITSLIQWISIKKIFIENQTFLNRSISFSYSLPRITRILCKNTELKSVIHYWHERTFEDDENLTSRKR